MVNSSLSCAPKAHPNIQPESVKLVASVAARRRAAMRAERGTQPICGAGRRSAAAAHQIRCAGHLALRCGPVDEVLRGMDLGLEVLILRGDVIGRRRTV